MEVFLDALSGAVLQKMHGLFLLFAELPESVRKAHFQGLIDHYCFHGLYLLLLKSPVIPAGSCFSLQSTLPCMN